MKNIVKVSYASIAISAGFITGCGGNGLPSYDKAAAEKQITNSKSLVDFMAANPDIAQASLKDIRTAAGAGGSTSLSLADATELRGIARNVSLAADKSAEAVKLIDEVIAGANGKSIVAAVLKIMAVFMNFSQEDMMKAEGGAGEKGEHQHEHDGEKKGAGAGTAAPGKGLAFNMKISGKEEKGEGKGEMGERPTCEKMMEDPAKAMNISQKDFDKGLNEADGMIKKFVSNCERIAGEPFAKCMQTLALQMKAVNENVTCSIKTLDDLEQAVSKAYGKPFKTMQKESNDCMKIFEKCGANFDLNGHEEGGEGGHGHADHEGDKEGHGEEKDGHKAGAAAPGKK